MRGEMGKEMRGGNEGNMKGGGNEGGTYTTSSSWTDTKGLSQQMMRMARPGPGKGWRLGLHRGQV